MNNTKIRGFFNLRKNAASNVEIKKAMVSNVEVSLDNLIILAAAILIASIGLNVNSIPVIIGAMLISPIMGPLFSVAYAITTGDKRFLKISFGRLITYVATAVVVSTLYFKFSLINTPTSELIARTNPTIYDILIAIFGGIAGIIAITRKEKTNVIPGVAIATALMPPLCTVGYGIANMQLKYVVNASVLFITNAYFIVITSMLVLFYLKIRKVDDIDEEEQKSIRTITIIVLLLILIVTIANTRTVLIRSNTEGNLDSYIYENINKDSDMITSFNIDYDNKTVDVVAKSRISESQKEGLKEYVQSQKNIGKFKVDVEYKNVETL